MPNQMYPSAREARWTGGLDLTDGTLSAVPLDSSYTYSSAHNFRDDLIGEIGSPVALTSVTVAAGLLDSDPVSFPDVANALVITAIVLFMDTGVAGTSALIGFLDTLHAGTPISFTSVGAPITADWPDGLILG